MAGAGAGEREGIWYQDPVRGLLRPDRLAVLLPRPGMTLEEQLNAVARFALCYAALLLLFRRARMGLLVALLAAGLTFAIHHADARSDASLRQRMEALAVERDPVTQDMRVVPTRDNPYMNILVTDYAAFPNRPPAADVTDAGVSRRAEAAFEHNLYRDQNDVFRRATGSRAYYTMPNTQIPNSQSEFARWLYQAPATCKEGAGSSCSARLYQRVPGG